VWLDALNGRISELTSTALPLNISTKDAFLSSIAFDSSSNPYLSWLEGDTNSGYSLYVKQFVP
jgi:hypothetical protein